MKPKHLYCPLVAGCTTSPCLLHISRWDKGQMKSKYMSDFRLFLSHCGMFKCSYLWSSWFKLVNWYKMSWLTAQLTQSHDWSSRCVGGTSIPGLRFVITTPQTRAPNDVTSTRWQCPYPRIICLHFCTILIPEVTTFLEVWLRARSLMQPSPIGWYWLSIASYARSNAYYAILLKVGP